MKSKKKIRYVSLDPGAILNEPDFVLMSFNDKGAYLLLLMHLYQNEGVLPFNFDYLRKICGERIENTWQRIGYKFKTTRGKLTIDSVSEDVKRAKNVAQVNTRAGLKSAESRRICDNDRSTNVPTTVQTSVQPSVQPSEAKGSEVKRSEEKSEAQSACPADAHVSQSVSSNGSSQRLASQPAGTIPVDWTMKLIYLNDGLCKIFPQRTPADTSSIRNLSNWVINRIKLGFLQDKIIGNVLAIARDSKKGKSRKPIAVFYSQLKTDLGYKQDG